MRYSSFAAALTAGEQYWFSSPFNYTVPAAGSTPDKYYMDNFRAMVVIPEPSGLALAGLAAAALVWRRRRDHHP